LILVAIAVPVIISGILVAIFIMIFVEDNGEGRRSR